MKTPKRLPANWHGKGFVPPSATTEPPPPVENSPLQSVISLMAGDDRETDRWRKLHQAMCSEAGSIMRRERMSAKLSLRELARRMKISAPYLSDMEHGKRRYSIEMAKRALSAMANASTDQQP